jgi:FKBP-type peptidyl-prolyl cis-trans isomerase (trigger factor)
MENQEQNSQSGSIKEKKSLPEIITESMATPFRSIVPFDYEQLRADFDEYWEMHGQLLERKFKFKGKKIKGGRAKKSKDYLEKTVGYTQLYGEVLWHAALEQLGNPLFFTMIKLESFTPERTFAICVYYKYPTIDLKESIDFKLERQVEYDKEKAWGKRCQELQHQYRTTSSYEGEGMVNETQQVLLDLTASCEGKPYPTATTQGMWFDVSTVRIKSLKEALIKHKKGDLFEVLFDNEEEKCVAIQVKIHDVHDIQVPQVDDELAKDAGFDDLNTLQTKFYEEYDAYVKNAEESQACDHILTEIVTKSEIGPVPNEYVNLNVDRSIKDFIQNHRGNKNKAMKSIGAKDENDMRHLFIGQVHRDLYQKLAMRYYAEKYELDPEDTNGILSDMRKRIIWCAKENAQGKM